MSSNIRLTRICQQCGKEFTAKTTVTKSCSDACAKRLYKQRKRGVQIEASNQETAQAKALPLLELQAKQFLSIPEACTVLGISERTLFRRMKDNTIKAGKLGHRRIIKKTDLEQLW